MLNYVININYNARAYLAKVLALVDQDDEPTPADKAHKVIQKTLNALRSALLKYKPELKLENNVHSGSSNYVDKLIGKGESEYAKTLLGVVVVNNSLECELVRILTGKIVRDREQCHDVLRKLKRSLGPVQESEDCRDYSKLVSNAVGVIENSSSQPPWYASIKCFLQEEL